MLYSTFLGGGDPDYGRGIALDAAGKAYLTGQTGSSDFPTTPGAFDPSFNGGYSDAYVTKLEVGSGPAPTPTTTPTTTPTSIATSTPTSTPTTTSTATATATSPPVSPTAITTPGSTAVSLGALTVEPEGAGAGARLLACFLALLGGLHARRKAA